MVLLNGNCMPIEPHPALNADRAEVRAKYNLRPLSGEESGLPVALLPCGVYGFTTSAATSEIAVFDKPVFRCFEVHKLADGEIRFAGYLKEDEYRAVEDGAEPVTVSLYPDPYEEASVLAVIPLSRIDRRRPPLRDAGSPMKLEISPKS